MSGTPDNSAIMEELESLFSWNPPPYSLATKEMGGSLSTSTRDPTWYDLHLAPDRICKRIVHVKDLHKKIARIVDDKLQEVQQRGITLEPPTAPISWTKAHRARTLRPMGNPMRNEQSVVEYYGKIISAFALPVASALSLHPHVWESLLVWSQTPVRGGDAICDGSLQFPYKLDQKKRAIDGTMKDSIPDFIDLGVWREMMEVHAKYGDIVTWEMKSLSVGDAGLMLGVMAMATGKEDFKWETCPGGKAHKNVAKPHKQPETVQFSDDLVTMQKLVYDSPTASVFSAADTSQPSQTSNLTIDEIWDQALQRGGSSLECVIKFDKMLMDEARGLAPVPGAEPAGQVTDGLAAVDSEEVPAEPSTTMLDSVTQPEGSPPNDVSPKTAKGFLRSIIRRLSQDDQGTSSNSTEAPPTQPRRTVKKISQDQTAAVPGPSSKRKGLKLTIPITIQTKDLLRRKSTRSKSPKKKGARGKGTQADECGGKGSDEGQTEKDPLTARSVIQQAWAQGVQTRSTFFVLHSGNYEYMCIRHRATQTLYVSDILHVPFVPGYMKLQIGLYIAGLEDAFRRYRQEKSLEPDGSNDDGQGPGPTDDDDDDGNNSDDDNDQNDGQSKPKRRRGPAPDDPSPKSSSPADKNSQLAVQQAKSRDILMIYLTYDMYDSIHPATFKRGARLHTGYGILTPGPLTSPSPFADGDRECELFLTSEIGQRTSGVLHSGVLQVELGKKLASVEVTAKLAFVNDHQRRLFHEWSVYMHMESVDVVGVPPILGVFHEAGTKGPSCLVLQHFGASISERRELISPKQIAQFVDILNSIHKAGIIHGNLRLDNMLVNDTGEVAIVDFDQAQRSSDPRRFHKEVQALEGLLEDLVNGTTSKVGAKA